jgi:predicted transcriptional regulator
VLRKLEDNVRMPVLYMGLESSNNNGRKLALKTRFKMTISKDVIPSAARNLLSNETRSRFLGRRHIDVALLCYHTFFRRSFAMSTTTIRLPRDLKERVARAAERAGSTAHSFILEAIAEKAEQEERLAKFQDTAEQRYAGILASGKTVPWNEMRRYLERRLTGNKIVRPKPRTLAR